MGNTEAQMIHTLTRDREWAASLGIKKRASVVDRLVKIIEKDGSTPREITSASRALAAFDRLDVERGKLQIEHDRTIDGESEVVGLFRKLLETRRDKPKTEGEANNPEESHGTEQE